ncbi:hypothetical protein NO113_19100, partial [Clostridioides difficile]|uniref:hypothetical protein n=1 Tax=Clostridioides difficile TaxID=1496 RepID=UPI00210C6981
EDDSFKKSNFSEFKEAGAIFFDCQFSDRNDNTKCARLSMRIISITLLIPSLQAACSKNESAMNSLPDINAVRLNLAFTCTHEADHLPPLDPEADKLFQYGRYLQKEDGGK